MRRPVFQIIIKGQNNWRVIVTKNQEIMAIWQMALIAPSITSNRKLLNSYYTLFPLNIKELEALDPVFSLFSGDWVAASFSSTSRFNAVNFWWNVTSKTWSEKTTPKSRRWTTSGPKILKPSHEQDLPHWRIQQSKQGHSLVQYLTAVSDKTKLKEMPSS